MKNRGVLMPAYASQYVGMGKELYDEFRVVQEYFEEASDCVGINFVKLAFASSDIDVHTAEQGPLLLFVVEASCVALLRSREILSQEPEAQETKSQETQLQETTQSHMPSQQMLFDAVSGMDMVSWYSALHAAQAITLPDGLYILKKWIEFVANMGQQVTLHTLIIGGVTVETIVMVTALCEQSTERGAFIRIVTVDESSMRVTGTAEGMTYLEEQLGQQGIAMQRLETPLFTDLVLLPEMREAFVPYFEKIDMKDPAIPVVSPVQKGYITTGGDLRACVRDLLVQPLRYDLIERECAQWREGIIAVPALHIKERIYTAISSVNWYTMETKVEYHKLIEHIQEMGTGA